MRGFDRSNVLQRTDLRELADEVLGTRKGVGRAGTWPCPFPTHGHQSGKTPPVSIFDGRDGIQRWRCHPCGRGGTAIDLAELTQGMPFRNALNFLGHRIGAPKAERSARPANRTPTIAWDSLVFQPVPTGVANYLQACDARLWTDEGKDALRWLGERGLGDEVLRSNQVGADPGPTVMPRLSGLPRHGPAVVFPVFQDSTLCYLQVRYLGDAGRRYENPSSRLFPNSPKLAEMRTPTSCKQTPADPRVLICEGMPDALSAAQAGERAVAILGAGYPDARIAHEIVQRFPSERIVVAFDNDEAGRTGAGRLHLLLGEQGAGRRIGHLQVPEVHGDLNGWLKHAGADRFVGELRTEISAASDPDRLLALGRSTSAPSPLPGLVPGL